jgi:hypothetical protein
MTQDEMRKLLGGYAANSLSEAERSALFEAALDDQELFDALQKENALRELLADPVTRAQVQTALQPGAEQRRLSPWPRGWLIGGLGFAAAAAITIALLVWPRQPDRQTIARQVASAPQETAQNRIEPKPEAPKLDARKIEAPPAAPALKPRMLARRAKPRVSEAQSRPVSPAEPAASAAAPAPTGVFAQDRAAPLAQEALGRIPASVPARAPLPPRETPKAVLASDAVLYQGPLVRYSVIRSGPAGDAIRIEVVSQLPGNLALYRRDAQGQWQRVYPANAPDTPVAANTPYQVPAEPLRVRDPEKLRLIIQPAGPRYEAQLAGSLNQPRARALQKAVIEPPPLVVEIPIGPN